MRIVIENGNCDYENSHISDRDAESTISIKIEISSITTIHSIEELAGNLFEEIQSCLSLFQWVIIGGVAIECNWNLGGYERQETDKDYDLDQLSGAVRKALCGPSGIFIDEAQVGEAHTYWQSRSDLVDYNVLEIGIRFSNDYALPKKDLLFIQYHHAVCLPMNVDMNDIQSLIIAKLVIKSRKKLRKSAARLRSYRPYGDRYFLSSQFDFHRTRLNSFPPSQIISLQEFNMACAANGLTIGHYLQFFRSLPYYRNL